MCYIQFGGLTLIVCVGGGGGGGRASELSFPLGAKVWTWKQGTRANKVILPFLSMHLFMVLCIAFL